MEINVPTIDSEKFLNKTEGLEEECKAAAQSLHEFGIVILKDPRVNEDDNNTYCELVEKYFASTGEKFYEGGEKNVEDAHAEIHY